VDFDKQNPFLGHKDNEEHDTAISSQQSESVLQLNVKSQIYWGSKCVDKLVDYTLIINKAEKHRTLDACCIHAMCVDIYCTV